MEHRDEEARFFIDLAWYEKEGRSFKVMTESRMCAACRKKLGTPVEEKGPVVDEKSGKVVIQTRQVPYGSNPFAVFNSCCAQDKDFISAKLPLLEAIFRILLVMGNQPLSLREMKEQLMSWTGNDFGGRDLSPERLGKVIGGDNYYGIRSFLLPAPGPITESIST